MNALALRVLPARDETWHSYLTRTADAYGVTTAALADQIGVRRRGRWPGFYGVVVSPEMAASAADRLNITATAVRDMHLGRYDQIAFDLTGLDDPAPTRIGATRRVVNQGWVHLGGTRFCPACLAGDGVWRLQWRIPWITVCPDHHRWLEHQCPGCGGTPGLYTTLHATAPSRATAVPDTTRCDLPVGAGVCGADLTTLPPRNAPARARAATARFTTAITTGRGHFAGQDVTSLQALRAWQAAIGLAIALGGATPPPGVRNHRWGAPPRDPLTVDELVTAATPLATAPTVDAAADVLMAWCRRAGISTPHASTFNRATQPASALRPVTTAVLARSGRAHALLARAQQDALTALPVLPWTVDDIPQVAWACALPPHRRDDTRPDQLLQRAVLAIICARMHTGADWPTSGALLGYPPDKARQWTRYCFSSAFPGLKDDLLAAAHQLAAVLPTQTTPDAWQHRPEVPNAHGMGALRHAQTPACRHDDPTSPWCPCAPPTPRNTRAQEQ